MPALESGVLTTSILPESHRIYYQSVLRDVLRAETIFAGLAREKVDFAAARTRQMVFSKAHDLHPAIGQLVEAVPFVEGAYLDGSTITLTISEHGNTIKTNTLQNLTSYWSEDFESLVREKLGRNLVESLEILARNAFLTTSHLRYPGSVTSRANISRTDVFLPDYGDLSRTNLQSRNAVGLNGGEAPICIIHPRVGRDIRNAASSNWQDVKLYADPQAVIRGEVGMLDGVRYVQNNFCRLPNAGEMVAQTTLSSATVKGQGGPNSDAQNKPKYVSVASTTNFAVGMEVTIHTASLGTAVLETDEYAEHRVIIQVDSANSRLYFDRPLLVAHNAGDYVTEARDLYASVMIGGPGLVFAVGLPPEVRVPPVIDDFSRIQRISWYGIFDFHLIEDAFVEVWITAASTANYGNA